MSDDMNAELEEAMRRGYVAAFRLLGNADAAHDALQEAAARALAARKRFDRSQPFYPWFHRILKNHCLDRLRTRGRVVASEHAAERASDGGANAEAAALASERARAVARAIEALDGEQREIIELRHFQDASYEEMAAILGCPIGTVMSRLYRARKALRKRLAADAAFSGGES